MLAAFLLKLLDLYKLIVSPHFAGSCRFLPSCADYARDAVLTHGALEGSLLTAWRLGRCHPFCAGGHDPVPARPGRARTRASAARAQTMPSTAEAPTQ